MVDEVDVGLAAGDLQGADVEVVAERLQSGLGHGPKVGALGVAAADQSVELLQAAVVAGPVGSANNTLDGLSSAAATAT